ncbi:MAG: class I SAM-dependent methyltransferase [Patescibacteria group bacterium]
MSDILLIALWSVVSILTIALVLATLYMGFEVWALMSFAPFVSSGKKKFKLMLDLAQIKEGTKIVELGSGTGELCLMAAERGAQALGIELNPLLVAWSRSRVRAKKLQARCRFLRKNLWHAKLPPDTDVVFLYGMPYSMPKIWKKLRSEVKHGTLIVSNGFKFPERRPEKEAAGVRLYRME